ncbi:hypothetical protein NBRC116583_16830 [Arenicella sp. 4NH20-0111]|uniref:exonuclease domain-containing protein n=1 Tax=Arenicella sp. 4NH20-0111 TaxID=3127648 RepID=UPI00310AB88A
MMHKQLPAKYYLAHANEVFDYVSEHCSHLLDTEHAQYLSVFSQLNEDAQCLLIRLLTRKHTLVKRSSLNYPEIEDISAALTTLEQSGLISPALNADWKTLMPLLTKPELIELLLESGHTLKASNRKSVLLEHALTNLDSNTAIKSDVIIKYIARRKQSITDYLFFLFFGDLRNRFQKFAMRDLGVLRVRKSKRPPSARHNDKHEAKIAFRIQYYLRELTINPDGIFNEAALFAHSVATQPSDTVSSSTSSNSSSNDRLLLALGDYVADEDPQRALTLWQLSTHPKAIEHWVRLSFRNLGKHAFEAPLTLLRSRADLPALSRLFIEDFYCRKYQGKRTSIYTDMLRESNRTLLIDEAFINSVEEGVINHYQQTDSYATFTENDLWKALFAFTFWELLYNQKNHSEFDRLPAPLRSKHFYQDNERSIEEILSSLKDKNKSIRRFTHIAVKHYNYPTGLFRWRKELLEPLIKCLQYSPDGAIANTLRRIAQNFEHAKDGYPDILVIENNHLRFEEIKAPGDVLRPNQLVSIQRLRESGFQVELTQVEWAVNPEQVYSVVDIETTGGQKSGNAITEIAVVKVKGGEIVDQWSTLVNPQQSIPRHITHLTGIDNSMVRDAPIFSEIANTLKRLLDNSIFVAHNVGFDYGFIKAAYDALGQSFRMPKYCTVKNARRAFPGLRSYSLGKLTEALDIELNNHHRALDDARATAHLLRLIQDTSNKPVN